MKNPQFVNAVVKRHNYNTAMHMLCIKMGWAKEYAWYFLRRDEENARMADAKRLSKKRHGYWRTTMKEFTTAIVQAYRQGCYLTATR